MDSIILGVGGKDLFAPERTSPTDSDKNLIRIVDPHYRCVSPFDLSVLRGDGVFEATTVWHGYPISLENHLKRLSNSARLMDMPQPNHQAFVAAINEVIAQYDDPEPAPLLRILVSRGMDPDTGIGKTNYGTPSVWMFLDGRGTLHDTAPITLTSLSRGYASDVTARAPWLLNGAKTLSYAVNQAMHRECRRRGVNDAVTYTADGFTLECPNSSIVAQYGDSLITPDPRIGILNGTSQREMFAWARQEGLDIKYSKLPIDQLREADRLFITHGGWVIPVSALDGRVYDVDETQVAGINDAIHSGRTHDDALSIGPLGAYEE
ncbi:aminodeoxychorismate lyase [Bifidobacterium subtile]|jgi:4-amino-4-deoxychorismate lyase|uniref:4-amino-4-deoxychorismate lyase n=1 Tax=Bifidobacterium subtile TaxID=77635 RepID=A0A087E8L2_9BIFI|nr:aminodeoxychorismate lyase [Bifidobacterium subtile]KFJ04113.1 4-amino-4-deoxychorismate lyase [Bifidobacterium subtile]MCI1223822.1 aminodeoxychorismate lyase [Bifidobacterium subtile]MCI1240594.1 aminodeoxychorismate lyase [Bifidobacterium subtile]MCI1258034.1 aminodeoxychorismate lyase [Bifidobacterium subtile]QOL36856.1 aminodeoxychorismate lyase [Bifidobacterium subtile]